MKKLILILFLAGSLSGCAFSSLKNCKDSAGNGVACSSLVENLEASESMNSIKINEDNVTHSDIDVEKSELVRLMTKANIDSNISKSPTLIPATTYKILILPYSNGEKYYTARYVFITAGKPKWVHENFVMSNGNMPIKVETPKAVERPVTLDNLIQNIEPQQAQMQPISVERNEIVKQYKVSAYLLNCREEPNMFSNVVAVFEQDKVIDVIERESDWWRVRYFDLECYINSKYLYGIE